MTKRQRQSISVILSLPSVIAFFLPFTYDVSPLDAALVWPQEWRISSLGIVMGIALLVFVILLRGMISDRLSRLEIVACVFLGLAGSLLIAANVLHLAIEKGFGEPSDRLRAIAAYSVVWVLSAAHVFLVLRYRKAFFTVDSAATAALMAGYLPNAIFCLLAFLDNLQIGAYVVLVACCCYSGMIAAAARLASRARPSS